MRSAQKEKDVNALVESDGLTAQQRIFVAEYLKDRNATQAAIRAGYSAKTAEQIGYQLLQKTSVAAAIAQQQKASLMRTLASADEVLANMWQLATFDTNELSQYRRGACRYCHGFGHNYQWRDMVEFEEHRLFPDAVTTNGSSLTMADGEVVENVLFPDTMGVAAALQHEAILVLMAENEAIRAKMETMSTELESLKLLVQQLSGPTAVENQ